VRGKHSIRDFFAALSELADTEAVMPSGVGASAFV
jgi:hypothetical protein